MCQEQRDVYLKDLELQWQDHFHMRNQTWKILTNSILFFAGVVGLEIKGVSAAVMITAYVALVVVTFIGYVVAGHHRLRQGEKFAFIRQYEELLGIYELKKGVLEDPRSHGGILGKVFTARYIEIMQLGIFLVALVLLLRRLFVA